MVGASGDGARLLRATFVHLPGIGPATEAELWRRGVRDWTSLRSVAAARGIPRAPPDRMEAALAASERALAERDAAWFGRHLPEREHWRIYPGFRERTAFLDIETTGLSPYEGIVTVVTVHGGGSTRTFVAGEDLEELPAHLGRFPILVTFNGSRFDVPFLAVTFPQFVAPPIHIDLRFVLYRIGLAGGLKRIEATLGLGDRSGVEGVDGLQAVRLWQEYRRGSRAALDRLVRYNRADTTNLEPLLAFAVDELAARVGPAPAARGPVAAAPGAGG
ncbi:MAG TPA: ribonuclease H-like domain-containing protein [Thermoplasmata archaeon]|nr:ribonuclease H-like domain-containing protein [Thermoplasmata archaeon]